jgi:hypothetical protein
VSHNKCFIGYGFSYKRVVSNNFRDRKFNRIHNNLWNRFHAGENASGCGFQSDGKYYGDRANGI